MDTPDVEEFLQWELQLTPHAADRARDRGFSAMTLGAMLRGVVLLRPSRQAGRWIATVRQGTRTWRLVLEPDAQRRILVVVTAYPVRRQAP